MTSSYNTWAWTLRSHLPSLSSTHFQLLSLPCPFQSILLQRHCVRHSGEHRLHRPQGGVLLGEALQEPCLPLCSWTQAPHSHGPALDPNPEASLASARSGVHTAQWHTSSLQLFPSGLLWHFMLSCPPPHFLPVPPLTLGELLTGTDTPGSPWSPRAEIPFAPSLLHLCQRMDLSSLLRVHSVLPTISPGMPGAGPMQHHPSLTCPDCPTATNI